MHEAKYRKEAKAYPPIMYHFLLFFGSWVVSVSSWKCNHEGMFPYHNSEEMQGRTTSSHRYWKIGTPLCLMHLSAITGAGYPLVLPLARGHFDSTQSILMLGVATGISRLLAFFHSRHNLFVHVQKNQPVTGSLQRIRGWYGSRPKWDANSFGGQVRHVRMTAFHKDQKVEAVFDDGDLRNWYPGVVDAINGDGTFNIRWDYPDGGPAISRIREEDIHSFTPPKRIAELVPGSVHIGTVVEVTSYGLFVDIGATRDGLVHVSSLKQGVKKLDDEVLLGQQVTVSWQIVQDRHAPASCHGQLWWGYV